MFPVFFKKYYWFFLITLVVALNLPSLNGPFILDDNHTIVNNAHIKNPANIGKIWTSGRFYSSLPATWGYRPVTTTSNLILWQVGDGATWPFHMFKWFLLILICVYSLKVWRELLPEVSESVLQLGILLFAINPVHSQLMGYISASSSLLASLFTIMSIWYYLSFRNNKKRISMSLSLICIFLAAMSKEEGVVVIGLLFALETFLSWRENSKISFYDYKKLLAPAITSLVGVLLIFLHFESTQNLVRTGIGSWDYFMTQWRAYIRYIIMFLWSFDLNADNLSFEFSHSLTSQKVLLALLVNIGVIAVAFWKASKQPLFLLVVFWFYASVSPSSSFIPLGEAVNDHRALTAYIGLGVLLTLLLFHLEAYSPRLFWGTTLALFVAYSGLTLQRSNQWSDRVLLWQDTVSKNPNSGRAYNNLATALMSQGQYQEALTAIDKCLKVANYYSYCHLNRAVILVNLGKEDGVNKTFATAVELDLHYVTSRLQWAQYLVSRGVLQKAKTLLEQADRFTAGNNLRVRLELIDTLNRMGLADEAKQLKQDSMVRFGEKSVLNQLGTF